MKTVTLRADDDLIERARAVARAQGRTLNAAFREWLIEFAGGEGSAREYRALMQSLNGVNAGRHFTREEMND